MNVKVLLAALAAVVATGRPQAQAAALPDSPVKIVSPSESAELPLLSAGQKAYLDLPRAERIAAFANHAYRDKMCKLGSEPLAVRISWQGGAAPYGVVVRRLPDGKEFLNVQTVDTSVSVDNLEIARRYEATVMSGKDVAKVRFSTEDRAPRLLRIPGVPNARDFGGWKTLDGRRVKQGLAIRTAGLNDNAGDKVLKPGKSRVSEETRNVLLDFFGIRSDVDLRGDPECLYMTGSPLGASVAWYHLGVKAYGMMNSYDGREVFAPIFRVFLDEKNYPIDFHCIYGKDRTGSVAFVLGALLGVSEEDLYRDWEATGFCINERDFIHRTRFDKLVKVFDAFPGRTIHARVRAYVKDLGFTDAEIDRFREFMLEDVPPADGPSVGPGNVVWIDGRDLPLEGKPFDDVDAYYHRLPSAVSQNVSPGVHNLRRCSAGMQFRFTTDSSHLTFVWRNDNVERISPTMSPAGHSGLDVYRQEADGIWRHVKTLCLEGDLRKGGAEKISWKPGTPCLVNLPLYNGIATFRLGVDRGAKVGRLPPRRSGVDKPVVFYGSSITQGACASRPGMSFVNIVGRELDVPVVNLGFSGAGKMEMAMSDALARIDASCYVLDSLHNMSWKEAPERFEPFVRNLRAKRPGVPIVICEQCDLPHIALHDKDRVARRGYEKFVAEGWKGLVYLPKSGLYADDEGTVDGLHPNDWGNVCLAKAYGQAVAQALGLKGIGSNRALRGNR